MVHFCIYQQKLDLTNLACSRVKRIFRYFKGSSNLGIKFSKSNEDNKISVYCDSAFADCIDARKSTSGLIIMYNGYPIIWRSKRQSLVTTSTCHYELIALSDAIKELIPFVSLSKNFGNNLANNLVIYEDNLPALNLATSHRMIKSSKHYQVQFHFVREQIKLNNLSVCHIESANNVADIFTKGLGKTQHKYLLTLLNMS